MSEVSKFELSDVYLHDRRGSVVRHTKRSGKDVTLCDKTLEGLIQPQAINRVCMVCDRAKREFIAQQEQELARLMDWQKMAGGKDATSPAAQSFQLAHSVGCVFGSITRVPVVKLG